LRSVPACRTLSLTLPHLGRSRPTLTLCQAPAPPQAYTLSLHDALPISRRVEPGNDHPIRHDGLHSQSRYHLAAVHGEMVAGLRVDRKSTRLNSSHEWISYAVFCLKKKK